MNIPQEIQELSDQELLTEYEGGIRHLTVCEISGQIDNSEQRISNIVRTELLNRMDVE